MASLIGINTRTGGIKQIPSRVGLYSNGVGLGEGLSDEFLLYPAFRAWLCSVVYYFYTLRGVAREAQALNVVNIGGAPQGYRDHMIGSEFFLFAASKASIVLPLAKRLPLIHGKAATCFVFFGSSFLLYSLYSIWVILRPLVCSFPRFFGKPVFVFSIPLFISALDSSWSFFSLPSSAFTCVLFGFFWVFFNPLFPVSQHLFFVFFVPFPRMALLTLYTLSAFVPRRGSAFIARLSVSFCHVALSPIKKPLAALLKVRPNSYHKGLVLYCISLFGRSQIIPQKRLLWSV